jgi:hypothetical protein
MIAMKKSLPRRTVLRGMSAALALPFLDAMTPALTAAAKSPNRLLISYIPIGSQMPEWTPVEQGPSYKLPPILKPLEPFRQDFTVLTALDSHMGNALGDGPGDHARAGAAYLTGVHPKKTSGSDIQAGVSMDQICAAVTGKETRFASLELGCEDSRIVGACDSGYSCAYQNSISWRTPTMPLPPETNPRVIFERLVGTEDLSLAPEERERRLASRKSILDFVNEDANSLSKTLGNADQRKLDEYLFGVREIERRIASAEQDNKDFDPGIDKPAGIPVLFADYMQLMFDLQIAAMQADLTRTMSLMYGREASLRTYAEIGVPEPHHPLTHHRGALENIAKIRLINIFHSELFAKFLGQLKNSSDGDGSLLDHVMIVHGSAISDGNAHSHENLPILVAGHGGGLKGGRHNVYPAGTPLTNLFLDLLDRMGVPQESIGDSTGSLKGLSEI